MVSDAVISLFGSFLAWLIGLMPDVTLPDWMTTVTDYVAMIVSNALALGNWIPWPMVGLAFVFIWGSFFIALGIRVARIVASFLTAGGGSAA